MMPKCSKLKWNHKPQVVSLQSFEHFDIISVVTKSTDHGKKCRKLQLIICLLQVNITQYILTVFLTSIFVENSQEFRLKWSKTWKCQANLKLDLLNGENHSHNPLILANSCQRGKYCLRLVIQKTFGELLSVRILVTSQEIFKDTHTFWHHINDYALILSANKISSINQRNKKIVHHDFLFFAFSYHNPQICSLFGIIKKKKFFTLCQNGGNLLFF